MFGFVERFITAMVLETTRNHWLGDQTALEAFIRFSDEELKHQELFRRIEKMMADDMPKGYKFLPDPDGVAAAILNNSSWAVLALILEIELFTQEHYKQSIEPEVNLSELYKDIFLFHWKEETTHAMMDALERPREDSKLSAEERDRAVDELIGIVASADGILQNQSKADVDYFLRLCNRSFSDDEIQRIKEGVLRAYHWQYIFFQGCASKRKDGGCMINRCSISQVFDEGLITGLFNQFGYAIHRPIQAYLIPILCTGLSMKHPAGATAIAVQLQCCRAFGTQTPLAMGTLRIAFDIYNSTIDRVNNDGATH
jgi:hypothetical protein